MIESWNKRGSSDVFRVNLDVIYVEQDKVEAGFERTFTFHETNSIERISKFKRIEIRISRSSTFTFAMSELEIQMKDHGRKSRGPDEASNLNVLKRGSKGASLDDKVEARYG